MIPARIGLAAALVVLLLGSARAEEPAPIRWRMPTEYPATAMPGEGIRAFAAALAARAGGHLVVEPGFEGGREAGAAAVVAAVSEGRLEAGDAFGGALGGLDPLLALSSLPFLARSLEDAHRLADLAAPAYARAFAARDLHLLYVVPWPASGIWSKAALTGAGDLPGLAIRTYDATSTAVLARAGARAVEIGFGEAMPRLRAGEVNAVLSSGDGGAGRRLWEVLPHFAAIEYAFPLSFGFASERAYRALPPDLREAVDAAAVETQARLWTLVATRLEANYARMRENGVAIAPAVPLDLREALRAAARPEIEAWRARAPGGGDLLDAFAGR